MKKLFLTAVVALSTLAASAQFMVVTTYDDNQAENIDKLTANLGFGYTVMDGITVGVVRATDASGDDTFDVWGRYDLGNFMEGAYLSAQMPTENMADNINLGLGMSFSVWNSLYLEPNYSMPLKETNGSRDGEFNIGIGYRF